MIPILDTLSLRARLILVYVLILGVGGLITSFIGSLIVNKTLLNQAKSKVHHDLKTARMVYNKQLLTIKNAIYIGASGNTIQQCLYSDDKARLLSRLEQIRQDIDLDFLSVTDNKGHVILRITQPDQWGDDVSQIPVIKAALNGEVAAETEILTQEMLVNENKQLAKQALFRLIDTPKAKSTDKKEQTSGMVLMSASPIIGNDGKIMGVLYGGHLLNRNFKIVDRVWELVYKGEKYRNKDIGTVTIFFGDLRISTNVKTKDGKRALGTRVSAEVSDAVLTRGAVWSSRAFVVNDWYISEYEPIHDYNGKIIGILYVGLLEKAYLAIRNRVVLMFIGVATIGFMLIILISYLITRNITRPLGEMVTITQFISAGDLNHEVHVRSQDEIGKLGLSFNTMVKSLKKMKEELEEWGTTLEHKVKKRTEELAAMQNTLVQSQRLASLGKLAAGIAHEINNPLTAIIANAQLLKRIIPKDEEMLEMLDLISTAGDRASQVVRNLLDFSRKENYDFAPTNINDTISKTIALVQHELLSRSIELTFDPEENLPPILASYDHLQSVWLNLILNAVDAIDDDIGMISITTKKHNNEVRIIIADTGKGISQERISRIFEPFYTTKEPGHGTGLGLSVCHRTIKQHGGHILVDSQIGSGTEFTVILPVP